MKKILYSSLRLPKGTKTLRIMKLAFILFFVSFMQLSASVYSQKKKFNISLNNAKLEDVLSEIEKESNISFYYKSDDIDQSKVYSVNYKNTELVEILDDLFENSNLTFKMMDNFVAIMKSTPQTNTVQQQHKTVKGTIVDKNGEPLPGVSIMIKGTTLGTITNIDGQYTLNVDEDDAVLLFSFIGFEDQEVMVGERTSINITLMEEAIGLDEVVVTGYGVITKEAYTGSASVVSSAKIAERPVASFQDVLRGNSPGTIVTGTGQPGVMNSVRLRGISSMNASNAPLYVVDGVVLEAGNMSGDSQFASNPLNTINPSDIKSMTVLKDAASASLYGSRGANGVIVITTKQGKKSDKPQYSVDVQMGVSEIFNASKPDMVNKDEFMDLWLEGEMHYQVYRKTGYDAFFPEIKSLYADKENYTYKDKNYHQWYAYAQEQFNKQFRIANPEGGYYDYDYFGEDADKLPDVNWYDEITRTAPFQKFNISTQGGSNAINYYASLEYFNQEGIILSSGLERYSLRMNLSSKPENTRIHWGLNNMVSYTDQEGPRAGAFGYAVPQYTALALAPVVPTHLDDGSYNYYFPSNVNGNNNPLAVSELNEYKRPQTKIISSGWLQLNFTDWLYLKSNVSLDYTHARRRQYYDKDFGDGKKNNGSLYERDARRTKLMNSNLLYFSKTFKDVHKIDIYGGTEVEDVTYKYINATGINFLSDDTPYLGAAATPRSIGGSGSEFGMFSWLTAINYAYNGKYYLSGNYRSDQSSRFSKDKRTGNFYSFSGAWRISEENFMKDIPWIDNMKLKTSYGINGTLPSDYYAWQSVYEVGTNYMGQPGAEPDFIASEDLTWEENEIFNIGADMRLFNRLSLGVEYYNRKTKNLLQDQPISSTSGFSSRLINTNAGLKNQGVEVDMNVDIIRTSELNWNLNVNMATLKNEFFGLESDDIGNQIKRNGESYYSWYLREWAGTDPETGEQRWYYTDKDGNNAITKDYDEAERRIVGKALPSITGGISSMLSFKGFDFSFLFTYGLGHDVLDYTGRVATKNDGKRDYRSIERDQLDRWTPDNPNGKNPIRINGKWNRWTSTRYLYSGDYLKLKNIKLQYTLPTSFIEQLSLRSASLFVQAENLFVLTDLKGFDPEIALNGYRRPDAYPTATTYTVGLKVNF
ncbi:SusC/RagA family TonB-linked outer membrane protein [Marinilabiliaceae bacterium JC017]|nr:SusC/RagA family TonB-linked outer membrane protein [Marinilabiliaceae bacterium JC017]